MLTLGFAYGYSNAVTLDQFFTDVNGKNKLDDISQIVSSYIIVNGTGSEGSIVYLNSSGIIQYQPYVFFGYNPIAATKILTSATINSITYTTTATGLSWGGSTNA